MVVKKKEGVLGEGEIKPFTKEELETWKWPIRIFLILAISVFIGWAVYTTPGLMNAKTADGSTALGPPSGSGNLPITGAVTPTPTPGQEKNQIDTDRNDPILSQRINRLETGGKTLMPINDLPQEIQIGTSSVYITGLTVNNEISGFIENRGKKALYVEIGRFTFITKDYIFATELGVIYIDGQYDAPAPRYFKPGQKKSFSTTNTKDAEGFKKLGGLPEDLKQSEQLLAQSSYLQITGFGVSDT